MVFRISKIHTNADFTFSNNNYQIILVLPFIISKKNVIMKSVRQKINHKSGRKKDETRWS